MAGLNPPSTPPSSAPSTAPPPAQLLALTSLVVLGGMGGTTVRAALEAAHPAASEGWPWATFLINVIGAFALGLLLEALALAGPDHGPRRMVRVTFGTGVLGGFTTYSTFMLETADLLRDGHAATAAAYATASLLLGVAAAMLGTAVAHAGVRTNARPAGGVR